MDPKLSDKDYLQQNSGCFFLTSVKRLLAGEKDATYKLCPHQSYYSRMNRAYNGFSSNNDRKFSSNDGGCYLISSADRLLSGHTNPIYKICYNHSDYDMAENIYEHAKRYTYGDRYSAYRL